VDRISKALRPVPAPLQPADLRTDANINPMNAVGGLPTANFQETHFRDGPQGERGNPDGDPVAAHEKLLLLHHFLRRVTKVTNPKFKGEGEGPIRNPWVFGPDCASITSMR